MNLHPRTYLAVLERKDEKYIEDGKIVKKRLQGERKQVIGVLRELASAQGELCEHIVGHNCSDSVGLPQQNVSKANLILNQKLRGLLDPGTIAQYIERLELRARLKARLDKIDKQLKDVDSRFGRSAHRDGSGFYGLTDYAQWALLKYGPICDALGIASVFGAGITFTTIFSTPRGNIGLMSWSFSLFNVGFVTATLIEALLRSTCNLPLPKKVRVVKSYWLPDFFEVFLHLVLLLAFACVTGAVILLSVTIWYLPWSASGVMPSAIVINNRLPDGIAISLSIATTAGCLVLTLFVGMLYVCHFGVRIGENVDMHRVDTADCFF
ncbi:hypothetical protein PAXRUDRAFT_35487 [Paxillus rubicundulus Ve08.2h10]|uniref:Uncharacterized protein n=1 Tax=Paxillus rubicundulus Ve08.2h10 TaxID=930991 RepID=A0A0D0DF36_9AGAM|nr:hypothetical protein PAXRUDRAFT_35487 [Paxillus rubicundulus Ve08.2h10]